MDREIGVCTQCARYRATKNSSFPAQIKKSVV
jgi:hypothetical protein